MPATDWVILTKFGPHQPTNFPDFKFRSFQMAAILKIEKSQYLKNRSTDFDEIWNNDAHWPSESYRPEKNSNFKNEDGERPPF